PGPAHLLHDGGIAPVALLDARRVQEDAERADEPDAPLDHERDVLVARERAVLDRAHALLDSEPQARAALRAPGGAGAAPRRPPAGGGVLLGGVGARRRKGAG